MDVVSAGEAEWSTDPFMLHTDAGRLVGRGAADMKGFIACMLAIVPELVASNLSRPAHFAFSYDEELGCRGAPHMIRSIGRLCELPLACIVGEPSEMQPVLSHKGRQRCGLASAAVQDTRQLLRWA
jgi:acetylornithine deacetylase